MSRSSPSTSPSPYLRNAWYVAAWAHELGQEFVARTLLDTPVILFRKEDGTPVALRDECPHRFAPLSMGRRDGDVVVCGYHGLRFAASGECIDTRYTDNARSRACVQSFPLVERDTIAWIWMGDADACDPGLIPDFAFFNLPDRSMFYGVTPVQANYKLEMDNLLDLSHLDYVHMDSIADGALLGGEYSVRQDGRAVHSDWWCPGIPTPHNLVEPMGTQGPVDHWLDMLWQAPASLYLNTGATMPGQAKTDGFFSMQGHFATPETEYSTLYFWGISGPPAPPEFQAMIGAKVRQAFEDEDRPMIEAVQRRMGTAGFWDKRPMILDVDGGAIRARRVLDKMILDENRRTLPANAVAAE